MAEQEADFAIRLVALTIDPDDYDLEEHETYQASFGIQREDRRFVVTVWFPADACPTVDLVRYAMNCLHLVLAHLARQTEGWRMDVAGSG